MDMAKGFEDKEPVREKMTLKSLEGVDDVLIVNILLINIKLVLIILGIWSSKVIKILCLEIQMKNMKS